MEPSLNAFSAAPHGDILALVVQIAVLLTTARLLGEVAQRLKQPSVVGEILAGILLGPSVLSSLFPALGVWIVPQTELQGYLLEVVSLVGVMLLLLITGLETDLQLIRHHARTALSVSWGGIGVTFGTGALLGFLLPDSLLVRPDQRLVFALFIGTAMSISAIPVIAKVLMDLGLIRRDVGQTILAAGMSDDTIGWILLSTVAGIAAGETVSAFSVGKTVVSVLLFLGLSITAGRWLVARVLSWVQDELISVERLLTLVIVSAFAFGAVSQALHLEAILGAFVAGIVFGQMPRLPRDVDRKIESVTLGVFAPIFFAVAGLKVNVQNLFTPSLLAVTVVVIAVATLGKVVGTYAGARLVGGKDHWTALAFGAGLNARGAMEIIIASVGLALGVLSQDMFSIIVVMAIVTSLMAPFALRWVLARVPMGEAEAARLRREELAGSSIVAGIHRVLVPVRLRPEGDDSIQRVQARVLERLHRENRLSITLMTVVDESERTEALEFLASVKKAFNEAEVVTKVLATSGSPAEAILLEAAKDYHLMVLGATRRPTVREGVVFSSHVDRLVREAPCSTLVVQGQAVPSHWDASRILVPTNGDDPARNAAELAFQLVEKADDEVIVLNVIPETDLVSAQGSPGNEGIIARRRVVAQSVVDQLRDLGETSGVITLGEVRVSNSVESGILTTARMKSVDLILLGTAVRPGGHGLFLGPRVERILATADCPVAVFNT
jgi:Kef-type K+ transport system membrane component KefB/nucleotide-binding universal stress UspA family protein